MAALNTLVLEASTYAGSVALIRGDACVAERSVAMRGREHEALMPAVAQVLTDGECSTAELHRIACGAGPGSFTSLRIAGGIAKGLALSLGVPLVPLSSLALIVASVDARRPGRYLAVLDALRGEHYAQLYTIGADGGIDPSGPVGVVSSASLAAAAEAEGATLVGPGIGGAGGVTPLARAARHLTKMIRESVPADLASWEPAYGRLAEAQVRWEAAHGRPLTA